MEIATEKEIAELIFNSEDTELNDLFIKAKTRNYTVTHLIWKITIEINARSERLYPQLPIGSPDRAKYLREQIRYEMAYYGRDSDD